MLRLRRATERGHFRNDWLDSFHTFSFGEYRDPEHRGVSNLRVINDDRIIPGAGFPTHPHRDMEIVTYVLDGALEHKDSMGNGSVIHAGEVQYMSAGRGVTHSEFNPSNESGAHLLQIWLLPVDKGREPAYAQEFFAPEAKQGRLALLASSDGRDGSIRFNADASLYATLLEAGQSVRHAPVGQRIAYVHVARGAVELNGSRLQAGDGATVAAGSPVELAGIDSGEALLFDLPANIR